MANLTVSTQVPDAVDIEYRINGTTTGLLGSAAPNTYWIPADPTDSVETRTVGASGAKSAWRSKTVPAVAAPTVTLQVREENTNAVAPFAIAFDIVTTGFAAEDKHGQGTYDPAAHHVEYKTVIEKVGDPSWQTLVWPKLQKVPGDNNVKGTKFEKSLVHVFGRDDITGTSSTFRFTTTAIETDTGRTATSSVVERTVSSPESFWSADEVYVVSPSGDLTGAPATNNGTFSTFTAARSAIASDAPFANDRASIWLENGQEYDEGLLNVFGSYTSLAVYTWGAGSKARVVSSNDAFEVSRLNDCLFSGIEIRSTQAAFEVVGNGWYVFDDIDTEVVGSFIQGLASNPAIIVSNSNLLDWRFNLIGNPQTGRIGAFMGCIIKHTPYTSSDEEGGGGYGIRNFNFEVIFVSQNDCHVRAGWFNNSPGISDTQPIMRVIYNSPTPPGAMLIIERNRIESYIQFSAAQPFPVVNILVRKNLFVGKDDTPYFIENIGYATITDNTFIRPATVGAQNNPTGNTFNTTAFLTDGLGERAAGGPDTGALVRGNLFINFQSAYDPIIWREGALIDSNTPPRLENNVRHFPHAPNPVIDADFSRVFNAIHDFAGYNERTPDNAGRDPIYEFLVQEDATLTGGTFEIGDRVRDVTTGYIKTFLGSVTNFRGAGNPAYTFEQATPIFDNIIAADAAGDFERFTVLGTLEVIDVNDNPTGVSVQTAQSGTNIAPDTGAALIGLITRTQTASHVVTFTGAGGFEIGETLSGDTATATIVQIFDDRLYLIEPTGDILSGESLSTPGGGAGTAASDMDRSGVNDLWLPITNTAIDGEYSAFDGLGQLRTFATAIKGPYLALPS